MKSIQTVNKEVFAKVTCTPCMKKKGLKQCEGCGQIIYNSSPPCEIYFDCPQIEIKTNKRQVRK